MLLPDLVIFDCDGVLIDSEIIFGRVLGQCLIAADFPITMDEAMVLGLGNNRITLTAEIESRFGRTLPDGFFETFRAHVDVAFAGELTAIPGIEELLAVLPAPRRLEQPPRSGPSRADRNPVAAALRSARLQCLASRAGQARSRPFSVRSP